mgnify:CR=1 FL=1
MKVHGLLLLDKPLGLSSNTALQKVKRLLGADKAGHGGTLDPMASGVLPLMFGEACKLAGAALTHDKAYEAEVCFGITTATDDVEGEVISRSDERPTREALLAALQARGIESAHLTLHVGAGTFLPVRTEDLSQHHMHSERYTLSPETAQAIARAKRALAEFRVEGMPTIIPFHQRMLDDDAFTGDASQFAVYTRWIEEEWDPDVAPYESDGAGEDSDQDEVRRRTVSVGVNGRSIEITLPETFLLGASALTRRDRKRRSRSGGSGGKGSGKGSGKGAASADTLTAPMRGTVVKSEVTEGARVEAGDIVVILEAMKMENPVKAHKSGVVKNLAVEAGSHVDKGAALLDITDE